MNEKLKLDWIKIIAAFSISTLVFISGLYLGSVFSEIKLEKLNDLEEDFKSDTLALELRYEILKENPCMAANSTILSEELYELGSKLEHMENSLGVDDPSVVRLKEYYSLLQLKHWLFMNNIKDECDYPLNLILYFYSNDEDCENCDTQGVVLSYLRKKYPTVRTYAFDYNYDNMALNAIKEIYLEDGELPAFIINDNAHTGFKNADDIIALFDDYDLEIDESEVDFKEMLTNDSIQNDLVNVSINESLNESEE